MKVAIRHLAKVDARFGRLIADIGAYALVPQTRRAPYESLVRAVAHQQLHGNAAESILARFVALTPGKKFPTPAEVIALPIEKLRGVGFSNAKSLAIKDIAAKTLDGVVPTSRQMAKLSDDEIVERLTQVRGVGRWTVEMLLIFQLGRLDVLPVDDFGVRMGFRVHKKLAEMPTPKELLAYGERWRPYRTVAAWYLWRAADRSKLKPTPKAKK